MFLIDKLKIFLIRVINNNEINEINELKKLNYYNYHGIKTDCIKWRHEDIL